MGVAEDVAQALQSLFALLDMSGRHWKTLEAGFALFVHSLCTLCALFASVVDSFVPFRLFPTFLLPILVSWPP